MIELGLDKYVLTGKIIGVRLSENNKNHSGYAAFKSRNKFCLPDISEITFSFQNTRRRKNIPGSTKQVFWCNW
jgi:hypothetical protein